MMTAERPLILSVHALRSAAERGIPPERMREVVKAPTITYPCPPEYARYGFREMRADDELAVVFDFERSEIVTVMFRDPMRYHATRVAGGLTVPPCFAKGSKRKPYTGPLCATCLTRVKVVGGKISEHRRNSDGRSQECPGSGRLVSAGEMLVRWKSGVGPETEWYE